MVNLEGDRLHQGKAEKGHRCENRGAEIKKRHLCVALWAKILLGDEQQAGKTGSLPIPKESTALNSVLTLSDLRPPMRHCILKSDYCLPSSFSSQPPDVGGTPTA
jgi:hypothetical protein